MENQKPAQKGLQTSSKSALLSNENWTPQDRANLAVIIGSVFDLQKQFGKQAGQLDNIVKGFCWALSPYKPNDVIAAFSEYIRAHSDFPTPYDLRQIIDPIIEPWKPDKSYYIKLQEIHRRDGPYGLNTDEIEYIAKYEEYMNHERKTKA